MGRAQIDKYNQTIGKRLFKLRRLHGFSQQYVAKRSGITFQQIQKYENGTNQISLIRLRLLAHAFNMSDIAMYQYLMATVSPESYMLSKHLEGLNSESYQMVIQLVDFLKKQANVV